MYLVQASPLTRIFLPDWHGRLLRDPALIASKESFIVKIPRPTGGIELEHGKPILASNLVPRSKTREVIDDEVTPLVDWLTNDQNTETDIYGVVSIPIDNDIAESIMILIQGGTTEEHAKLIARTREKMAQGIREARAKADERVMRACGKMYNIVKQTIEEMQKTNTGIYSPSYSEALAMTVMKDRIKSARVPDERAQSMMRDAMSAMSGAPTQGPPTQQDEAINVNAKVAGGLTPQGTAFGAG